MQDLTNWCDGKGEAMPRRVDEVRTALRAAILRGTYAPKQRLIESDLVAEYDTTRFVLRNALLQLAADGLVEMQPNRGARVREISLEEAVELIEVRRSVESLIAGRAAERITEQQAVALLATVQAMAEAVAGQQLLQYSELNAQFHVALREIAGHTIAGRIIEQLNGQMVRHQFMLSLLPGRPEVSLSEHRAVAEAVAARDVTGAVEAMQRHLDSVLAAMSAFRDRPLAVPRPH